MKKYNTYHTLKRGTSSIIHFLCIFCVLSVLSSCSISKHIQEDDQLYVGLKKIQYKGTEATAYPEQLASTQAEIEAALAAAPNGSLFGSSYYRTPFPYRLWIWNATQGSKSKVLQWINKTFGKGPVLMSNVNPTLRASVAKSVLRNNGYIHGNVTYEIVPMKNPRNAKIAYTVIPDTLFIVDSIRYTGFPKDMQDIINSTMDDAQIKKGDPFKVASLDGERTRLSQLFRNNGYYYYSPQYTSYLADTFEIPNRALLRLQLADSLPENVLKKWYIGRLRVKMRRTASEQLTDSISRRYLTVIYGGKRSPIRPGVILRDMKLRPRSAFSYSSYIQSMQSLNSVGLYSSTDFQFTPRPGTDTLDVDLTCTFDKPYDFYIEGNLKNRTIGRLGPELKIGLTRRNAFRGGEKLDINVHGSYEWQTNGVSGMNSYSYGADATVEFPRIIAPFVKNRPVKRTKEGVLKRINYFYATPTTTARLSVDVVNRPSYYRMNIFSAEWGYSWQTSEQEKHQFSPLVLKYQVTGNETEEFKAILANNPYMLMSMESYLIPKMKYTYTYQSKKEEACPFRWETTLQQSGNLTSLAFLAAGKSWNEKDKSLLGTTYSQFVKLETEYMKAWPVGPNGQFVIHGNLGFMWVYGNSNSYPFTEGYYVGGANSIRAFTARSIGPGSFKGTYDRRASYMVQHGDMRLILNAEFRYRLFGNLYGALFLDAGNVWSRGHHIDLEGDETDAQKETIRLWNLAFEGASFKFKNLFKELATGTGIGLRYDLGFLVVRVDWGLGLHVPYDTNKAGYFNIERFKDMHSLHLAIGYPF